MNKVKVVAPDVGVADSAVGGLSSTHRLLHTRVSDVELSSLTAPSSVLDSRNISLDDSFNSLDEPLLSPLGMDLQDEIKDERYVAGVGDVPLLVPEEEVKLIGDPGVVEESRDAGKLSRDSRSESENNINRFIDLQFCIVHFQY